MRLLAFILLMSPFYLGAQEEIVECPCRKKVFPMPKLDDDDLPIPQDEDYSWPGKRSVLSDEMRESYTY